MMANTLFQQINYKMTETTEFDTFCINCMQDKGNLEMRCPYCGYDQRKYKVHPLYLKPRTLLKNQYIIGKYLGQGGFGITYIGVDQWLQKRVAIKEYLPSALATRDFHTLSIIPVKRQEDAFQKGLHLFIQEARHLAKFNHPNIVKVINFFEENQTGYMVMEYLEGDSPEHILTQAGGRLPVANALAIIWPILDALSEIHAHYLYHCDISVQNIRILTTGVPILIDFGAARHRVGEESRSLALVLKHGYSPLEQYSGRGKIGPWTDIYACGALLYLLITGTLPPAATDRFGEDSLISPATMLGVDLPDYLNCAIMKALAIKLEERFQTVAEFKAALSGKVITLVATTDVELTSRPFRQHNQRLTILLVVTLLLIALTGIGFYWINDPYTTTPYSLEQAPSPSDSEPEKLTVIQEDNSSTAQQNKPHSDHNLVPADDGILKKVDLFYQLARLAQEKGQFTESLQQVQQGLQLMPTHSGLLKLKTDIIAQQQAVARSQQIQQLLEQAIDFLTLGQLDLAYTHYQKVLSIDSQHPTAKMGLQQVADRYEQLVRQETLFEPQLAMVKKGLAKFPTHSGLLSLQRSLMETKLVQQREAEARQAKQQKIAELLKTAQQQLTTLRLTEPAGDNAYDTYQAVLQLETDNQVASTGLIKIANEYERLAQLKPDNVEKNLEWIEKGLTVLPTHAGLLALRQTMKQKIIQSHKTEPIGPSMTSSMTFKMPAKLPPVPVIPAKVTKFAPTPKIEPPATVRTPNSLNAKTVEEEKLQPHPAVGSDLSQKVQEYEKLAQQQIQLGHFSESLALINKGLAINPTHSGLLTWQQEVLRQLNATPTATPKLKETDPARPPPSIIFAPSF